MDSPIFFILVIIAVIVVAMLLPRVIRRSTNAAGSRAEERMQADRLARVLAELGTTLTVLAPAEVVRAIADEAARADPRRFTILGDGLYGIRFIDADDAVVRLVDDAYGIRLEVERFTEYLGRPNTGEFWGELRSRVETGADARGVSTSIGPGVRHTRRDDGLWVRAD